MKSAERGPGPGAPRVSVVVRTKDRPLLLAEALESLRQQSFQDFETIVVNDSDTPLTPELIGGTPPGRALLLVEPGPPHGRARAANRGLASASGTWVAYLDDDDLYLPDHLGTLVTALEEDDGCRAAFTSALLVRQTLGQDGRYHEISREPIFDSEFDPRRLLFSNTVPLLCLMHGRSLVAEAGGFDETFDLYEDWDFLIRLARRTSFLRVRQATTLYRTRDDGTNATIASPWRSPASEAARGSLFRKHWAEHTPEAEIALLNILEDEAGAAARYRAELELELAAQRQALAEVQEFLADVQAANSKERESWTGEREASRAEKERLEASTRDLRGHLDESISRGKELTHERDRLQATVHQMTTSLAWRLFTPWWKLKAALGSRRPPSGS